MKKPVFIWLCVILFPLSCFAQDKFDGYLWEKLRKDEMGKEIAAFYLTGFLDGFLSGHTWAGARAATESVTFTYGQIDKWVSSVPQLKQCAVSWQKNKKAMNEEAQTRCLTFAFVPKEPKESMDYRTREVDSFLSTFPLCKRLDLRVLFSKLSLVWYGYEKTSYKSVGEDCLK
jgi:hypothetical protein